jgi:hypothetical protein
MRLFSILFLLLPVSLFGQNIYSIHHILMPVVFEQGQGSISVNAGFGYSASAAYALSNHVGLCGQYYFRSGTTTHDGPFGKHNIERRNSNFEMGAFYFQQIAEGINLYFQAPFLYGQGSQWEESSLGQRGSSRWNRYTLQPTLFYVTEKFELWTALRAEHIVFPRFTATLGENLDVGVYSEIFNFTTFIPSIGFRFGKENLKISIETGSVLLGTQFIQLLRKDDIQNYMGRGQINIGLVFYMNRKKDSDEQLPKVGANR